jgi:hypothetical protein
LNRHSYYLACHPALATLTNTTTITLAAIEQARGGRGKRVSTGQQPNPGAISTQGALHQPIQPVYLLLLLLLVEYRLVALVRELQKLLVKIRFYSI